MRHHTNAGGSSMSHAVAQRQRSAATLVLAAFASSASAMGGHFDVADAAVLAPQRCQVDLWALRGEAARLWHIGPACRVGPVELGLTLDRLAQDSEHATVVGAQIKWATAWLPQVDVGVVASALHDTSRGGDLFSVYAPLTWSAQDAIQLHANVGADRNAQGHTTGRIGMAGEWAIDPRFTLLAERFRVFDLIATRVGVRIALGERARLYASGARLAGSGNQVWGLGVTVDFGR